MVDKCTTLVQRSRSGMSCRPGGSEWVRSTLGHRTPLARGPLVTEILIG
ncbi:hypothetical protein NY08_3375 [Rhodococcus sp. B7740]|nr:hypothetical protein NY08_3375 [Rhodococcus sp. B7740]